MGGGPVMEDMYVPYHWPFSGFHSPSFYAASSAPLRYCDLDVESALVELIAAFQDWPSCNTMNGNLSEEVKEAVAEGITNVVGWKSEGGVSDSATTESLQSEEVEKSVQSDGLESSDKIEDGRKISIFDEVEKIVQVQDNEKTLQLEEMEMSLQSEEVDSESGSDEERRAATIVQARYRAHLVRMSRPLVQLREIARIEDRLKDLKEQVGDGAFLEELRRKDSMAKLAFEEGTMKLLLQLDNIQGSHSIVRQIRKSVAREIVSLQESVDAVLSQSVNTSR